MQYYNVTLNSLPGLGFAHNIKSSDLTETAEAPKTGGRLLEITVYRSGGVCLVGNGETTVCENGAVSVIPQLGNQSLGAQLGSSQLGSSQLGSSQLGSSQLGSSQLRSREAGISVLRREPSSEREDNRAEYLSVGVTGDFTIESRRTDAKADADSENEEPAESAAEPEAAGENYRAEMLIPLTFKLPAILLPEEAKLSGDVYEELLRKLILGFTNSGSVCDLHCTALIFELLHKLDSQCRSLELEEKSGAAAGARTDMFYSRLILRYISDHICEKIRIGDISSHLSISVAYLSKQFREATGMTVVDCINRMKVARIRELIVTRGITLREAGELVGITDVNYLSRLFKRYSGMSVGELKRTELRGAGYSEDVVDIHRLRGK